MLTKAEIVVLSGDRSGLRIPVMYNPTEISDSWTVKTGGEGASVVFNILKQQNFSVTLFFDTYETKTDVREKTQLIANLMQPTVGSTMTKGSNRRAPPLCGFSWSKIWIQGIIVDLKQKFIMFLETGQPVRAQLTVTFKPVLTPEQENQNKGLFECRKLWVVKAGERLDVIAAKAWGDCGRWRLIAEENGIYNPLLFPSVSDIGRTLILPDIHK